MGGRNSQLEFSLTLQRISQMLKIFGLIQPMSIMKMGAGTKERKPTCTEHLLSDGNSRPAIEFTLRP